MTDQPTSPSTEASTADLERRIADLERRSPSRIMRQGRSGIEEAFWALMHNVFPEDARKHLKAASREQLLAARVYLDRWVERLDESEAAAAATRPHEKIEVE